MTESVETAAGSVKRRWGWRAASLLAGGLGSPAIRTQAAIVSQLQHPTTLSAR